MKKNLVVTPETFQKLAECFSNAEEYETFFGQMDITIKEISFLIEMRNRVTENDCIYLLMRQVCALSLFVREHIDLMHQFISKIEVREMTDEEMEKLKEQQ